MPNAYRYHRFSSTRQDKGSSILRQAELTEALCRKNNWTVVETLEDKGRSAWTGDHLRIGNLGKFRQRVDAGEIEPGSYLVIENLDRLSRQDVKLARRWIEDITDAGILVAVCTPEIILDVDALSGTNIVSMLQYLMEAGRSNKESDRKSQMQTQAVARFMTKARKGEVYTALAPKWLKGEKNGTFEVIEERAEVVRQIYQWAVSGLGYHSIAKRLNGSVPAWTTGWKYGTAIWKYGYIKDILNSPVVEGEYHVRTGEDRTYTGERIMNYYPRIVDADLVARARAAIASRRNTGGPSHAEARNLFVGKCRCGHCGESMVRSPQRNSRGTKYEYLRCLRVVNGGECVNTSHYRYDTFERAALDRILHDTIDNSFFAQADETGPLAGRVADIKKEVELREAEQQRLIKLATMLDDVEQIAADLNKIRLEVFNLKLRLAEAEDNLARARGAVTPDEHIRRVMELKDAIYSEDDDLRNEARRKVRDAMQSVVDFVICRRNEVPDKPKKPERQLLLSIAGSRLVLGFDNDGNLLRGPHDTLSLPESMLPGYRGLGDEQAEAIKQRRIKRIS